jgi:hypothetical protein
MRVDQANKRLLAQWRQLYRNINQVDCSPANKQAYRQSMRDEVNDDRVIRDLCDVASVAVCGLAPMLPSIGVSFISDIPGGGRSQVSRVGG